MSQTSASTCEALTGAAPCFPSRNILGCVCGPVPPSDEDSGSARTTCTLPQERVGALDVIPVAGGGGAGRPGRAPPWRCGHLCWAGGDRKEKPLPSLITGSRCAPRPPLPRSLPSGSSVNVNSNREPRHGVWRDNLCHQGHPQTLRWALSLSGGSSGRCCSGARGHPQAWV